MPKPISEWTLDDFAKHYAETLASPPNGWGQNVSPLFGVSHMVMLKAQELFGCEETSKAFERAIAEKGI